MRRGDRFGAGFRSARRTLPARRRPPVRSPAGAGTGLATEPPGHAHPPLRDRAASLAGGGSTVAVATRAERGLAALAAVWIVLAAALALLLASGVRGAAGFAAHAALHAAMFAPLALVLWPLVRVGGRSAGSSAGAPAVGRRRALAIALGAAALARLLFLAAPPALSGDIYRAIWEGRVVAAGHDPWRSPPDAPELEGLRARHPEIRERVEYWKLPAIYPPGAQAFAAAVTAVSTSPRVMKAALVLAEVGLVAALIALLRRRGRDPLLVVAYAWNPLPLVEIAGSGHGDVLGVALAAAALAAIASRPALAGALAALSGTVKFAGFALLPFLWRCVSDRRRRVALTLAAAVSAAVVTAPFLSPAAAPDGLAARLAEFRFSLGHYLRHWRFNDSLFPAVEAAFGAYARPVAFALLAAAFAALLARRPAPPATLAFGLLAGAAFLLTPTAHPWYLLWCLPFLVLHPERRAPYFAALALTLTTVVAYYPFWTTPPGEPWTLPLPLRLLEYLPPIALLALGAGRCALRSRRGGRGAGPAGRQ